METAVLIVGAGAYGIGLAWELHARGVEVTVVGDPFSLWFDHTLSTLRLRSDLDASEVPACGPTFPIRSYLDAHGFGCAEKLPVSIFRAYLREVVAGIPFPLLRRQVRWLDRDGEAFRSLFAEGGQLRARTVVLATGPGPHRYLPPALARLPPEVVTHTWEAGQLEELAGERILVIGGGQSAAEAVAHLRRRNDVTWALRRPPLFCREPLRVPTPLFKAILALSDPLHRLPPIVLGKLGTYLFRPTITPELAALYRDGGVPKLHGDAASLELRVRSGTVVGAGGIHFHRVVAATGYRPTVEGFPFLVPRLAESLASPGAPPRLDARFETPVRGLHVIGAAAESRCGPVMRFLLGARLAARRLAPELAKRFSTP